MVDYTKMSAGECHTELGADAEKWTEFFYQTFPDANIERSTMFGWVCNMIMAGHDNALGNQPLCGDHAAFLLGEK
jgi:hypothetical protein